MNVGEANWFTAALKMNEVYDWTPRAPFRAYFGTSDTDVSPQDSLSFYRQAIAHHGNVSVYPLGPITHTQSAYLGVPLAREWFDTESERP
jgi:hypothetical protein